MFNDILIYPFLKAVCVASDAGVPQFKVGETQLRAMSKKKQMNLKLKAMNQLYTRQMT